MRLAVFLLLFGTASIASYLSLTRRLDERLGGAWSAIVWGVATFGAFNLETRHATDTAVETATTSQPALAFICFVGLAVMGLFFLAAAAGSLPAIQNTRFGDTL
jgi:predicted membrane channel-forming protein YqfA (hemolysin III family)